MDRSPGFGFSRCHRTPVKTRFPYASSAKRIKLTRHLANSLVHSTKGTPSGRQMTPLRLLVSIWFQVLFHSPIRGTFHLSLTVLVHYRSRKIFSLGRRSSRLLSRLHVARDTCLHLLKAGGVMMAEQNLILIYGAITLSGCPFQVPSNNKIFLPSSDCSLFARRYLGNHKLKHSREKL